MTRLVTEADATLSSFFEEMRGHGAPRLREEAWEQFLRAGLPNKRIESWHYTDLKFALRKPAPLATSDGDASLSRTHDALRLVLLDGAFQPELSDLARLPEDVSATPLCEALAQGDAAVSELLACRDINAESPVVALNAALMQDGVVLRIAPGAQIETPIEIVNAVTGEAAQSSFTRSLVIAGAGARATLIETHGASTSAAQINNALVLRLGEGASIELVTHIGGLGADAVRVASLVAQLEESASLNSFALIESGGLLRRQVFAALSGEDARVSFNGATLGRGRDHSDTTLVIDHGTPRGESRERFRSILDEQSVGVFQGKIIVRPGAQKTDGSMQSKALLLSDGAAMNNKPELEIFADDVQCGHGATCGRLDKDQLFYLTARGLPRREAEALLIEGFANEALEGLENAPLRDFFAGRISDWLSERDGR